MRNDAIKGGTLRTGTVFVDVGGTTTRVWGGGLKKKTFATDRDRLPGLLKRIAGRPDELVIGLRGVWTPPERAVWKRKLRGVAGRVTVLSDIELAHRLAFPAGAGIVLNAGTGSIAFGVNAKGQGARAGGLGPLLGDEGSAFWIGQEFLKRRGPGQNDSKLRSYVAGKNPVAAIARKAAEALRSPRGRKIVRQAARDLASLVQEVKDRLHWKGPAEVRLAGGLFRHAGFRRRVETILRRKGDRAV